jgi:hypothetical protein
MLIEATALLCILIIRDLVLDPKFLRQLPNTMSITAKDISLKLLTLDWVDTGIAVLCGSLLVKIT